MGIRWSAEAARDARPVISLRLGSASGLGRAGKRAMVGISSELLNLIMLVMTTISIALPPLSRTRMSTSTRTCMHANLNLPVVQLRFFDSGLFVFRGS